MLFRFKELLQRHAGEIAAAISAEHGKVLADAHGELTRGLQRRRFGPGRESGLGGGHGLRRFGSRCQRHLGLHPTRGRVEHLSVAAAAASQALAVDEMGDVALGAHTKKRRPNGLGQGILAPP